jgi:hypothetical protein
LACNLAPRAAPGASLSSCPASLLPTPIHPPCPPMLPHSQPKISSCQVMALPTKQTIRPLVTLCVYTSPFFTPYELLRPLHALESVSQGDYSQESHSVEDCIDY